MVGILRAFHFNKKHLFNFYATSLCFPGSF